MARTQGILVRDDEPELRGDIAPSLLNVEFFVATTGHAGEWSDETLTTFDVVLLDMAMPGLDDLDGVWRFSLMPRPMLIRGRGEDMPQTVADAAGMPESRVICELTEDSVCDSSVDALAALARLRLAGFGLSLDDAGRRQSGLLQVENLPITEAKIDLETLAEARRWAKLRSIFGSIAELGRCLGLSVVAQGVETRDDLALVRSLPVDYVQGYLVSRKLLLPDLLAMLAACPPHGPLVSVDNAASAP